MSDGIQRALQNLDWITPYELHKVCLNYFNHSISFSFFVGMFRLE